MYRLISGAVRHLLTVSRSSAARRLSTTPYPSTRRSADSSFCLLTRAQDFPDRKLRPFIVQHEDAADVFADDSENHQDRAAHEQNGHRERGPPGRRRVIERTYEKRDAEGETDRRGEKPDIDGPAQRQRREIQKDVRG